MTPLPPPASPPPLAFTPGILKRCLFCGIFCARSSEFGGFAFRRNRGKKVRANERERGFLKPSDRLEVALEHAVDTNSPPSSTPTPCPEFFGLAFWGAEPTVPEAGRTRLGRRGQRAAVCQTTLSSAPTKTRLDSSAPPSTLRHFHPSRADDPLAAACGRSPFLYNGLLRATGRETHTHSF